MEITVNGKKTEVKSEMRLTEFLESKGLDINKTVVEYNGKITKKEKRNSIVLKENDNLEVLNFVGGG